MADARDDRFEALYRAHAADLLSFAYSLLKSWPAAEDVVHDVFLGAWNRRESIDRSQSMRGYLYTSVYNSALNILKRDKRFAHQSSDDAPVNQIQSESLPADAQLGVAERDAQVRRAVAALPERMRQVAVLRWAYGLTRAEIAATLGTSEKTVANQLHRAGELLREKLDKKGE